MDYTISVTVEHSGQRWYWRIVCNPEPPLIQNQYVHMVWQMSDLWAECLRVHRVRPAAFPIPTSHGRYWAYDMPRSVMDTFITAVMRRGHTAAHMAQAIAQLCGYKLQPYTQGPGYATVAVSEHTEVRTAQLTGPVTPVFLSVNGRVYELSQTSESDIATATLSDIEEQRLLMQQQYEAMIAQANHEQGRRIEELEMRLRQDVRLPVITINDVMQGMVVYTSGSNVCTLLACGYRPKYVIRDDRRYMINPDYYSDMWRENLKLLIHTQGSQEECQLCGAYLLTDELVEFQHYHQSCLGNYQPPVPMRLPEHAYRVRDEVQRQMEIIDFGGMATGQPVGLPRTTELTRHVDFSHAVSDRYGNPVEQPVPVPNDGVDRPRRRRRQPEGDTWTTE